MDIIQEKQKKKCKEKKKRKILFLLNALISPQNNYPKLKAEIANNNRSNYFRKGSRFIEKFRQICNFERCWAN